MKRENFTMRSLQSCSQIALLLVSVTSHAGITTVERDSFQGVVESIDEHLVLADAKKTLVIFDLDETLVISEHCPKVPATWTGLRLFEAKIRLCEPRLTSSLVPKFLDRLKSGFQVMGLTARRKEIIEASLLQLKEGVQLESQDFHAISFETAPNYSTDRIFVPFTQRGPRSESEKELVIQEGIAFASGANKGQGLEAYLEVLKPEYRFDNVIFVDDQKVNIRHMENAFRDRAERMLIIHYTEHQD